MPSPRFIGDTESYYATHRKPDRAGRSEAPTFREANDRGLGQLGARLWVRKFDP